MTLHKIVLICSFCLASVSASSASLGKVTRVISELPNLGRGYDRKSLKVDDEIASRDTLVTQENP